MEFRISKSSGYNFAKKSGDYNKIHIDEIYGYNSIYGEMICHGCNIFNIAVKKIIKSKLFECRKNQIDIFFNKHFTYNENIRLEKKKNFFVLKQNGESKASINYFNNKKFDCNNVLKKIKFKKPKCNVNIEYKKNKSQNFQNILNFLSRYVGMVYPGKNSIIESIKINYSKKEININPAIYSKKIKKNYPFIKNYMIFKNFILEFDTLIRPVFIKKIVKPKKNLIQKIHKNEDNILIIGASSGLGSEMLNLLLLNKKKKIYATYFKNIIKKKSKNLKIINCDITKSHNKIINLIIKKKIKKIYYFPSNKILMKPENKHIKIYKKIYLFEPLKILKKLKDYKIKFFFPSTTFINDHNNKLQYSKIKFKAELELKKFGKKYKDLKINILRLPQLNTKQNLNLMNVKYPNLVEYLNLNSKSQKKMFFL